jgi:methionine aminopeptidase
MTFSGAITEVIKQCLPGRKVVEICTFGDKYITDQCSTVYKTMQDKGIAFPTCISINNCVGHFSPLSDDTSIVNEGDLVKVYVIILLWISHIDFKGSWSTY